MSLLSLEGFDRLASGAIAGSATAWTLRSYDEYGWQMYSGNPAGSPRQVITCDAAYARYPGGKGLHFDGNSNVVQTNGCNIGRALPASWTNLRFGFNFYPITGRGISDGNYFFHIGQSGSAGILLTTDYRIMVATSSVLSAPLTPNAWTFLEVDYQIVSGSTVKITVYADGQQIVQHPSASIGIASPFFSLGRSWASTSGGPGVFNIDDFYMADGTGDEWNAPIGGPFAIRTYGPAESEMAQFTPVGAATNPQAVGDMPDDVNTYVTSTNAGDKDVYSYGINMTANDVADVLAIQASTKAYSTTSAQQVTNAVGTPTAVKSLSGLAPRNSPAVFTNIAETNPATGMPWTRDDVSNLRTGYRFGSTWN